MIRKFATTLMFVLLSALTFAQEKQPEAQSFWKDPLSDPMLPIYLVSALVVTVAILVTVVGIYIIRVLNVLMIQQEQENAKKLGIAYVPKPSWWNRFSQQMNASVPVEQEKTIELDHSYDGIKELDNHLPPWWKWLFYTTIGWSVVYLLIFHVSASLPLSEGEYQNELALAEAQAQKLKASQPQAEIDENALVFSPDSVSIIANGKKVFIDNNCGSCHRNDGGGNAIGPNLTDEYWLHGGHIK
ncbi:MAG: cbb3-type cytochrome c oxidase N-terminal domain-containing protein, partial [Bacteroidota bacterium]